MIYQIVLISLGPYGRRLLDFLTANQLIIMSLVFLGLIIEKVFLTNKGKNNFK
ncbi:hypothetical protein [Halanaerobium salsuginis]|jgi:hypothetical protein|uniref:Uncharacterized protein n=1 Tax=Halanaerobium salsuginis TaxID=29563 RepID=A0A1I4JK08_9FIRM|nr:hypothetical protein [Halanaerobium salsuginis]SFL66899.1 hypothetical protein SAMN02983006_01734 [Halanaerobium salsuginis]